MGSALVRPPAQKQLAEAQKKKKEKNAKTSKWGRLKTKAARQQLNKEAQRVLSIMREELTRPVDGFDIPPGEAQRYVALNEVRRLRARLAAATRSPERDVYKAHLHKAVRVQQAIKRNPDRHWAKYGYEIGRSRDEDVERMRKQGVLLAITAASDYTAVDAGMHAGGILRDVHCSTPRRSAADFEALETEKARLGAEAKARADAFEALSEEEQQEIKVAKILRRMLAQRLAACFTQWQSRVEEIKQSRFAEYAIYVRRAVLILPSVPRGASDGSKSKLARVLKVAEVDPENLTLQDNPPVRPEPNVESVLIVQEPSEEEEKTRNEQRYLAALHKSDTPAPTTLPAPAPAAAADDDDITMIKSFPTIRLPVDPDKALRLVRPMLKLRWGLDAHVLSYTCDEEQESDERGWRLFEVESHDASWIPERKVPGQQGYREGERFRRIGEIDTNDMEPAAAARVNNLPHEEGGSYEDYDRTRPLHGAQWMELAKAVGTGARQPLDVGPTSRAPQMASWYEPREIRYARARQREAAGCVIAEKGSDPIKKRPPWRQMGWWTFVADWIDRGLREQGWKRDGPLYQVSLTNLRCVLRCATQHNGDVYFSAHSKKSRGRKACIIAPFLASYKFWRRQVPFVVSADAGLRWLLTQDVRWRLKVRIGSMDDEEPDDEIYGRKFARMELPEYSGTYASTQIWIRCLRALAECQIDSDFRSTRMKEMQWPVLDHHGILARWKSMFGLLGGGSGGDEKQPPSRPATANTRDGTGNVGTTSSTFGTASSLVQQLIYKGELRSDQVDDLSCPKMLLTLEIWLTQLFEHSRIPPLVLLHERFRPEHCFVARGAGNRGADLFAFSDMEGGIRTHPLFAVQRLFDEWPGAIKYDDGMFLSAEKKPPNVISSSSSSSSTLMTAGDDPEIARHVAAIADEKLVGTRASTQKDRRLLRDSYLKCWKRWVAAAPARRDFCLARKLWPLVEACRMATDLMEIEADSDRAHQRDPLLREAAPTLRACASLAAEVIAGLHDGVGDGDGGNVKRSALRPVRAWDDGVINLQSEDGDFEAACKVSSDIDVRSLIWRYLELAPIKYEPEETDLKSPRVRDSYVAFDVPLHTCGIRDGDTLTFKIIKLPPVVRVSLTDELGRLKDTFKGTNNFCPDLPKIDVFTPGSTGYAWRTADRLIVETVVTDQAMRRYKKESAAALHASLHDPARAGRPRTPTCGEGEGPRFFSSSQKVEDQEEQEELEEEGGMQAEADVKMLGKLRLERKYAKNKEFQNVPLVLKSAVEMVALRKRKGIKSTW
jgi:hypothetical protein